MTKINIPVTLQTREVKYEVKNKTHEMGQAMQAAGKVGYESASYLMATEDEGVGYELNRAVSTAIADVKTVMGEWLEEDTSTADNLVNGSVESGEAVVLDFKLTGNYNRTSVDALASGIHEYVVWRAIYELCRQTYPEIADACQLDANAAIERAKLAVYARVRPKRPSYVEDDI